MESYSGKSIKTVSAFPPELEVIFESSFAFRVKLVEEIPHPNRPNQTIKRVTLEQL